MQDFFNASIADPPASAAFVRRYGANLAPPSHNVDDLNGTNRAVATALRL